MKLLNRVLLSTLRRNDQSLRMENLAYVVTTENKRIRSNIVYLIIRNKKRAKLTISKCKYCTYMSCTAVAKQLREQYDIKSAIRSNKASHMEPFFCVNCNKNSSKHQNYNTIINMYDK